MRLKHNEQHCWYDYISGSGKSTRMLSGGIQLGSRRLGICRNRKQGNCSEATESALSMQKKSRRMLFVNAITIESSLQPANREYYFRGSHSLIISLKNWGNSLWTWSLPGGRIHGAPRDTLNNSHSSKDNYFVLTRSFSKSEIERREEIFLNPDHNHKYCGYFHSKHVKCIINNSYQTKLWFHYNCTSKYQSF